MSIDPKQEARLWDGDGANLGSRSESEWGELLDYLLERLSAFLGRPVVKISHSVVDGEALSCHFGVPAESTDPLALALEGLLGTDLDGSEVHVSATLFVFSSGERLRLHSRSREVVELVYRRQATGSGEWESRGWCMDEFGEYQAYSSPTELPKP